MYKAVLCAVAVVLVAGVMANDENERRCNLLDSCSDCIRGSGRETNNNNNNNTNGTSPTTSTSFNLDCYWCSDADNKSMRCREFDFDVALPVSGVDCPNALYNVGTCEIEALWIIIMIAVACLLIVIMITCCCCCCCIWCGRRRKRSMMIQQERYDSEKDAIRERSADRRAERKSRNDDIRRKYDLM